MKPVDEELELARLLASEASPLGASLSVLRERGPDASELGLLASRLSLGGIDVAGQPKAPVTAPKPWKPWLLAGGGGAAMGLIWLALRGAAPAPGAGNAGDAGARSPVLQTSRNETTPRLPTDQRGGGSMPASSAANEPAPADAASAQQAEPAAAEAKAAAPSLPGSERAAATTNPATPAGAAASVAPRGSPSLGGPAAGAAPGPSSVPGAPSEIELLRDARLALRQSPGAALAFAEQHARLYPQGKLTQERELIAISALVATGRRTAALSRGARFEQAFPTSPYKKQLGELLK